MHTWGRIMDPYTAAGFRVHCVLEHSSWSMSDTVQCSKSSTSPQRVTGTEVLLSQKRKNGDTTGRGQKQVSHYSDKCSFSVMVPSEPSLIHAINNARLTHWNFTHRIKLFNPSMRCLYLLALCRVTEFQRSSRHLRAQGRQLPKMGCQPCHSINKYKK